MVPREASISDHYSPRELVTGVRTDYKKHLKTSPGKYCLVHDDKMSTNTMAPRATRAIAIGPDSNLQGSYKFYLLDTGAVVTRRSWDEMVVTAEVIQKVEEMAKEEDDMEVEFEYHGTIIRDDDTPNNDSIEEGEADPIQQGDEDEDPASVATDVGVDDGIQPDNDAPSTEPTEAPREDEQQAELTTTERQATERQLRYERRRRLLDEVNVEQESGTPENAKDSYAKVVTKGKINEYEIDHFIGKVYAQMISKKYEQLQLKPDLKRFGAKGQSAVKKEIKSFQDFDVLVPLYEKELSDREKWDALPLMMMLKEKRDGTIKGRAVAGGHRDRGKIPAEEATSPTVSTEALYLTCTIDAMEGRFVGLLDVPSAYFHAKAGRVKSHIKLDGVLVDLFLQVEPEAAPKVTTDKKGNKVLYTKMNKAL